LYLLILFCIWPRIVCILLLLFRNIFKMFVMYLLTRMKKQHKNIYVYYYNVEARSPIPYSCLVFSLIVHCFFSFLFPSYRVVIAPRYIVQTSTTWQVNASRLLFFAFFNWHIYYVTYTLKHGRRNNEMILIFEL